VPIALLAALALVAVGASVFFRRTARARTELPAHRATTPEAEVSKSPAVEPPDLRTARVRPPDPHDAWVAEIRWRHSDEDSRFCVVARTSQEPGTVLAESSPLVWPPADPTSVQELVSAAEELSASLVAAGWRALPPGDEWYAKRFSWEPVVEEPAGSPAGPRRPSGRFGRRPGWPDDTDELWRCEIEWHAGSVYSRFHAAAYPPGAKQARAVIGVSSGLESLPNGRPDPQAPRCRAEVRALAAALEAGGWKPAGRGAEWFAARFVWQGEGAPPDRVDPVATEARQAP
jgi:hypothetical protein